MIFFPANRTLFVFWLHLYGMSEKTILNEINAKIKRSWVTQDPLDLPGGGFAFQCLISVLFFLTSRSSLHDPELLRMGQTSLLIYWCFEDFKQSWWRYFVAIKSLWSWVAQCLWDFLALWLVFSGFPPVVLRMFWGVLVSIILSYSIWLRLIRVVILFFDRW